MFRRGLAVLLCSAMLVGSLPETSFAAEIAETTENVTAESETAEAEPELQADDASTESEENAQASQTAVTETQTVSGTETGEIGKTETTKTEADTEALEETGEPVTQTETATVTETEIVTETATVTETEIVTETATVTETETVTETGTAAETETETVTATEPEETTIVETEETVTEEVTQEETTEEAENAEDQQQDGTLGNENVAISNVKVAYNSISFDYEVKNSDVRYIRIGSLKGAEKYIGYNASGSITIKGLSPSTEYSVYFTGYSLKEVYYNFSQVTEECPYNVKYEVTSARADEISLSAEITAKEGAQYELPEYFRLNWKCFDENGKHISNLDDYSYVYVSGNELPDKITAVVNDPRYIFENSKYTFEMWISEPYDDDFNTRPKYAVESGKEVTTPKSVISDANITFTQNEEDSSRANYTISTGNYTDSVSGVVYFRMKGSSEEWNNSDYWSSFETEGGTASGQMSGLALGSTYEYMLSVAGFKKTGEYTNGEAKLKWDVSYDVGAIDAVVSFKIDETTKVEGASYEIYGECKRHTYEWENELYFEQREDKTYTAVASSLRPNAQYDISITVYEYLPNGSENRYVVFENVTTKASAVKTNNIKTYLDAVSCQVAFDDSVRTIYNEESIEVYPYIKGQDGKYTLWEKSEALYLYNNEYNDECFLMYGLESNKEYEITLGYMDYEAGDEPYFYEYGTMTFKTEADDRRITIETMEAGVRGVTINGMFKASALPYESATLIHLLCRESGTDKWMQMEMTEIYVDEDYQSSDIEIRYELSTYDLESGKSYEYAVGIGSGDVQDINDLKDVKKGTMKLKPDERSIEVIDTRSLLNGVEVKAKLLGKYIDDSNDACLLYREKGNADASWNRLYLSFYGDSRETSGLISSSLKAGATYEYRTCMAEKIPEKEEDYAKLEGGEFTYAPPADDRALEVEITENRTTARFAFSLTGNRAIDNYITLFYREKGSQNWNYVGSSCLRWEAAAGAKIGMVISGLTGETEYEYIAGISNQYIGSYNGSVDDLKVGKKEGTFTTKGDERKLGTPIVTAGYSYADLEVAVDGLTADDTDTYVSLYTKNTDDQNAKWIRKNSLQVNRNGNTAKFSVSGLEQGRTYDYALVISDGYRNINPDSEEFNKLPENKKLVSKFETKKSEYTLEITEDEKSVFDKEILKLKAVSAAGYNEKNFEVALVVREKESNDLIDRRTVLLNSTDYIAEAIFTNLSEKTKYDVTATLYAKIVKNNNLMNEAVATKEFSFTTKAAAAPTELKADVEELYLNSWNPDYNPLYAIDAVRISVPDGASNEVTWTSSNPDAAYVLNSGIVIAGMPGEATITAASVLAPNVTTAVKVHVKNYGVILSDKKIPVMYNSVYTLKNKVSTNIIYASISDDGTQYIQVKATGTSDDPSIAYWDEEKQCIVSKNVGVTYLTLEADGYKTELEVAVFADSPDFDLNLYPTQDDDDVSYPAIKNDKGYQIAVGEDYSLSAIANPETVDYDINDVLSFTSSDPTVLTVSDYGYVNGLKKGTATVTVAYDMEKIKALASEYSEIAELAKHTDLASKTKTVTFDVRPTYSQSLPEVHAITNIHKTLGDVKIGEGWTWRDPETPLYSLPNNGNAYYAFEAEYTGADFYNYEGTVKVYLSTITGVNVINDNRNVISADGKDSMTLTVKPALYGYAGLVEGKDYEVSFTDTNVTITPDAVGYRITAAKKGKYTLKPEIKVNGTVVASGNYAITVVEGELVDYINIEPETDSKNVTIKGNTIYFNSNAGITDFKLKAAAFKRETDKDKEITATKLTWTISDKSVADIDAKASDRNPTVKIKGEGHAVIQVTAGDEAKASAQYRLEVRNYKPRVEGDKITINTAYDYTSEEGYRLSAKQYGVISVATAYGDGAGEPEIVSTDVEDGEKDLSGKISKDFVVRYCDTFDSEGDNFEDTYVIEPVNPNMAAGKYNVKLAVTTGSGFTYTYPLTITVINKQPKVTAKVSNSMNLFYLSDKGYLDITLEANKSKSTDFIIESIKWNNNVSEGFKLESYSSYIIKTPNVKRYYINGSKVKIANGKLADPTAASGTVTVRLEGVREQYELPVTVKYSYKQPKLTTADWETGKNVSTILPSVKGGKLGSFAVMADKKQRLYYSGNYGTDNNWYRYYNDIRCANDKVSINKSATSVSFTYSGTETQFDIPLTIDSYNWREALTVTHKVKTVNPTAVLNNAKLTYNTNYDSAASAYITLKDYPYDTYRVQTSDGNIRTYSIISAVDASGADEASYKLLASDKLQIKYTGAGMVSIRLNTSKLGSEVPKGATYVLTPYYFDAATGKNVALNTLTLKLTFTNKPVTAKVSGKGKIDLAISNNSESDDADWLTANSIVVTPKFANLGSGYSVTNAKLSGEYSKYFTLYKDEDSYNATRYLKISGTGRGKLKAGHNYNLSIIYTLEDADGNRMTVKSTVLKVKPVQKAPKITVAGDNKILYAAASDLYRTCEIRTPYYNTGRDKDYYRIKSAYGSLDTNKDGKADIKVSLYDNESEYGYAMLKIQLADKDAVVAAAKGKSYTIPVTVELVGRDGISKDATVKIKVTVKR